MRRFVLQSLRRWSTGPLALQLFLLLPSGTFLGCLAPTNPCDPAAPLEVQSDGTRLAGTVVDQHGQALAGVVVGVAGLSQTSVSAEDGTFAFDDIPPSETGYEVQALIAPPSAGGRAQTPALACKSVLEDIVVRVLVPPQPPEIEVVKAAGPRSLVVAFGAITAPIRSGRDAPDPDSVEQEAVGLYLPDTTGAAPYRSPTDVATLCQGNANAAAVSYRVQVRAPFEEWHDALLTPFPWLDDASAVGPQAFDMVDERVEDVCAVAVCKQFAYLDPLLSDARARCADVVGFVDDDGTPSPLTPYGTYEVRVLTEEKTDSELALSFALPARVRSAPPARAAQMTLVPGALLPLAAADGTPLATRSTHIGSVIPVAGGRFVLLGDETIQIIGGGADVFAGRRDALGQDVGQDALATDEGTDAAVVNDWFDDGALDNAGPRAIAALPAGDWVRVIKQVNGAASIEKMYIGITSSNGAAGAGAPEFSQNAAMEPPLPLNPDSAVLGGPPRSMVYLEGDVALTDAGANPRDAYLLLYPHSLLLIENARIDEEGMLSMVAGANGMDSVWAGDGARGECASLAADLAMPLGEFGTGDDLNGKTRVSRQVCFDVGAALGETVDLTDVEKIGPFHVIADAANDRVFAFPTAALAPAVALGAPAPLRDSVLQIGVGRRPVALQRNVVLSCDAGADERRTAVVLVANAESADVSALGVDALGAISEIAVVPLPVTPRGFVKDPNGATCADPFAWVVGVDGKLVPIDLRGGLSIPDCDNGPCVVSSRGRATAGAVGRALLTGRGRAVVGGPGLLGELGFFRPKALQGAGFELFDENTFAP